MQRSYKIYDINNAKYKFKSISNLSSPPPPTPAPQKEKIPKNSNSNDKPAMGATGLKENRKKGNKAKKT